MTFIQLSWLMFCKDDDCDSCLISRFTAITVEEYYSIVYFILHVQFYYAHQVFITSLCLFFFHFPWKASLYRIRDSSYESQWTVPVITRCYARPAMIVSIGDRHIIDRPNKEGPTIHKKYILDLIDRWSQYCIVMPLYGTDINPQPSFRFEQCFDRVDVFIKVRCGINEETRYLKNRG